MSRKRFEPLPDEAFVFRLAETGKLFLPHGARFPNANLFEPSTADIEEAVRRGRRAGVSVWEKTLTTLLQAAAIRYAPDTTPCGVQAFGLDVGKIRSIGREHRHELDVVADPLPRVDGPGARGHGLIEGLRRPDGQPRPQHKLLLAVLADSCEEVV